MLRDDCMAQTSIHYVKCIVATCFMQQLLVEYPKCFIVGADNVGSKQMQRIRIALRGSAGNPSLCQFCHLDIICLCVSVKILDR